jgi:hypothetical protein
MFDQCHPTRSLKLFSVARLTKTGRSLPMIAGAGRGARAPPRTCGVEPTL